MLKCNSTKFRKGEKNPKKTRGFRGKLVVAEKFIAQRWQVVDVPSPQKCPNSCGSKPHGDEWQVKKDFGVTDSVWLCVHMLQSVRWSSCRHILNALFSWAHGCMYTCVCSSQIRRGPVKDCASYRWKPQTSGWHISNIQKSEWGGSQPQRRAIPQSLRSGGLKCVWGDE